jgi:hypothetical protein
MFLARRREAAVGGRDGAPGEEDQRGRGVDLPISAVSGRGARTSMLETRRHGSEVGDGGQARNFHGKREGQRTAPNSTVVTIAAHSPVANEAHRFHVFGQRTNQHLFTEARII